VRGDACVENVYLYEPGSYAPLTQIDQLEEEGQEVYTELLTEDRMQIIQVLSRKDLMLFSGRV